MIFLRIQFKRWCNYKAVKTHSDLTDAEKSYTLHFSYDKNNRLTRRTKESGGFQEIFDYCYDANGNCEARLRSEIRASAGEEDKTEELVLTQDNADAVFYRYDAFNRLVSVEDGENTAGYTYDGNNLRQSKTVNGVTTTHIYDGAEVTADITGDRQSVYVRDLNGILFREENGEKMHYISNPRGDVSAYYYSRTRLLPTYTYDAFGNQTEASGTDPFRYSGEYYDAESGFIYLRNRYYDPSIGRFITEDPYWNVDNMIYGDKEYKDKETKIPDMNAIMQSANLYAYCMNNPMKYVDPTGQEGVAVTMLWDAFFGGGSYKDYSYNQEIVRTFYSSPNLNKIINANFEKFKRSGLSSETYSESVSFYGNDLNPNDFDLHLAVGLADYSMVFTKEIATKRFLWKTWNETVYNVKITVSDRYNFDNYREGQYFSDFLNNWGYNWQKFGSLKPYYWSVTFAKKGLE